MGLVMGLMGLLGNFCPLLVNFGLENMAGGFDGFEHPEEVGSGDTEFGIGGFEPFGSGQ